MTVYQPFSAAMSRYQLESTPTLAIAVSGGSDSMALVYLAEEWAQQHGGKIIALTVDHGLREESAREAATVHEYLSKDGIDHHILRWDGDKPDSNIQSAAREARYRLLASWCREHHILHLLVAHHLEDQAETMLLRLERGSGIDGLSCMASLTSYQGIRMVRPLLAMRKQALQEYLLSRGKKWVEDPSNLKDDYTRNRIRHCLSLEDDLLTQRLAATASHLGRARASLEMSAAKALVHAARLMPEGYAILSSKAFQDIPEEEGLQALAALLVTISGHEYKPRFQSLQMLYQKIKQDPLIACTLWGCAIIPQSQNEILICREVSAIEPDKAVEIGQKQCWDGRFSYVLQDDSLSEQLSVGALTKEQWRNLRKEDPTVTYSVPNQVILTLPALKALDSVLAIPHIDYYRGGVSAEAFLCRFQPVSAFTGSPFCYT